VIPESGQQQLDNALQFQYSAYEKGTIVEGICSYAQKFCDRYRVLSYRGSSERR
jgi:hypothetical protein